MNSFEYSLPPSLRRLALVIQREVGPSSVAWVARVRRRDGEVLVLGFHASRLAAMQQAHEFNRRYQTDTAAAEEFDASAGEWPGASATR